jgi:hypothetical protein
MSVWKCAECGATGQQHSPKAARRAFEHHVADAHGGDR